MTDPESDGPIPPLQVPDYRIVAQPIVSGRQPARPGQPARWEDRPGEREEPGVERPTARQPHEPHEKA